VWGSERRPCSINSENITVPTRFRHFRRGPAILRSAVAHFLQLRVELGLALAYEHQLELPIIQLADENDVDRIYGH
jgi:hypothetical protein